MKEETIAVPVITWDSITVLDPCKESLTWAKDELRDRKQIPLNELVEILLKHRRFDWANWLVTRLMDKRQRVRYAVFAAKKVLPIFEAKYPNDKRPAQAIEAAEEWIRTASSASAAAAYAASAADAAANDAAYAAYAAAYAAYDAAANAANDAAYAAYAAYAAAYAAYDAAANAAGRDSTWRIILNYGIQLLSNKAQ